MKILHLLACTAGLALIAHSPLHGQSTTGADSTPWKVLFDGKTITGLKGVQKTDFLRAGWSITDGALVLNKKIKDSGKLTGGDLATADAFTDFEFSFEWKLAVSGDSGVIYFNRSGMGQRPAGNEFQLIDDVRNPDGLKGGPPKRTGALYGILPPNDKKQLKDGEWNEGLLRVQGSHVEHWINGEKVLEYTLGPDLQKAAAAAKAKVPTGFGTKTKSPVILLDQGEEVSFRNLRIRPLPATP